MQSSAKVTQQANSSVQSDMRGTQDATTSHFYIKKAIASVHSATSEALTEVMFRLDRLQ